MPPVGAVGAPGGEPWGSLVEAVEERGLELFSPASKVSVGSVTTEELALN